MATDRKRFNKKVCLICGAPHSGSTLLGLILGSHSICFYAGEANKVKFLHANNPKKDSTCKMCGQNCPVWGDFHLDSSIDLYEQLSKITKKQFIIDSTKKPSWLRTQIENLADKDVEVYLIYLFRDGRAVINSRLRKYKDYEPITAIDRWSNHLKKTNRLFNEFSGKKIKVHYKDLALNPEKITKTVLTLFEIDYEPSMLNFYQYEHHPLGGNTGTQSLVVKAQKGKQICSPIELTERNKYYYKNHPLQIKYDQRWKNELDSDILELFNKKVGAFNDDLLNDKLP
jgi:hypothetical protein